MQSTVKYSANVQHVLVNTLKKSSFTEKPEQIIETAEQTKNYICSKL